MILLWRIFARFERFLTISLFGIKINPSHLKKTKKLWPRVKAHLKDSFTWKSLAYLFIKFPLGIISFVILVTFISVSLSFIVTPFIFVLTQTSLLNGIIVSGAYSFMNTYWFTGLIGIVGLLLVFVSLHIFNFLARLSGIIAKVLLEKK
jgi:hypothetical protein